jgi:hypothetical protein
MKKTCLDEWLNALRSTNYTRCNGALHKNNEFCAFGVLCDISKLDTWKPDLYTNKMQYLGEVNYLPKKVREWAGMSHEEYNIVSGYILCFNDNLKMSLPDIGNFLEQKYKKKSN